MLPAAAEPYTVVTLHCRVRSCTLRQAVLVADCISRAYMMLGKYTRQHDTHRLNSR